MSSHIGGGGTPQLISVSQTVDMSMPLLKPFRMDRRCHVCFSLSLDKVETSFNRPFRNSTGNLGRVSNFNQSINRHRHIKDHVEIDHLTKYNLVPRSLEDEAEGEIWPNPICIT